MSTAAGRLNPRAALAVLLFAAGLALMAYPPAAQVLSGMSSARYSAAYDAAVDAAGADETARALAEAAAYNENLSGNPVHDPFLEGSGMVVGNNYRELLDVGGDGVMGHISIPKISVDLPIRHGTSDESLASGAGHLEGSSLPVGGDGSHCVLTGHSGLVGARLFSGLDRLEAGDRFYLKVLGQTLPYEVDRVSVVEPDDVSGLARVAGEDLCTLVTCTPYGVNTHRLLVRGHRVYEDGDGGAAAAAAETPDGPLCAPLWAHAPAAVLLAAFAVRDFLADSRLRRLFLRYNQGRKNGKGHVGDNPATTRRRRVFQSSAQAEKPTRTRPFSRDEQGGFR